jgi:hypothetical protein
MSEKDNIKTAREILVQGISRNAVAKPKIADILEFILIELEKQTAESKARN